MSDLLLFALGAVAGFLAHAVIGRRSRGREAQAREILERELTRLRTERREEANRIAVLERQAAEPDPRIEAENEALRRRMDELADAIMAGQRPEATRPSRVAGLPPSG